jgi:predicted NAD/FAD-dependent oxidoreductase
VNPVNAKYGNRNIIKGVFALSEVTLKTETRVEKVNFDETTKTYTIQTANGEEEKGFNYVVLAGTTPTRS